LGQAADDVDELVVKRLLANSDLGIVEAGQRILNSICQQAVTVEDFRGVFTTNLGNSTDLTFRIDERRLIGEPSQEADDKGWTGDRRNEEQAQELYGA